MIIRAALVLLCCLLISIPVAQADSIKERYAKLPPPSLTTQKSTLYLEKCIGIGISEWMTPIVVRGEHEVLIAGYPNLPANAVYMLVKIQDTGSSRTIAINAHKGWDDKTVALIRSCMER